MGVVSGVKHIIINGEQWPTDNEAKYSVQTRKATSLVGGNGRLGRSEEGVAAFIEVKVYASEGRSTSDLVHLRNADVSLVCEDRTITLGADADNVAEGEVAGKENSLTVRFESKSGREVF